MNVVFKWKVKTAYFRFHRPIQFQLSQQEYTLDTGASLVTVSTVLSLWFWDVYTPTNHRAPPCRKQQRDRMQFRNTTLHPDPTNNTRMTSLYSTCPDTVSHCAYNA